MIYFESSVVIVEWREDLKSVSLSWKGFAQAEDFRTALNKGLELIKLKRSRKWLGNTQKMSAIPLDDQNWVNVEWFPKLIAAGVTSMAVVLPASAIAKMSVNAIISKVGGLEIQNFGAISDAENWLRNR
jgi:hypothetical protein